MLLLKQKERNLNIKKYIINIINKLRHPSHERVKTIIYRSEELEGTPFQILKKSYPLKVLGVQDDFNGFIFSFMS